jgi:hypothetical protein
MSLSKPALAYSFIVPPPQLWNRSGGSPDCITVGSFDLNASFSRTVILMVTLGWSAM